MITAHIKSPFGDRTEEWDDNKVKPEFKRFLVEFDAYVIGFEGDGGEEILGFFDKDYWDIHEEVLRFYACEGNYPGLMTFVRGELKKIGANFQTYLTIEKPFVEQAAVEPDALSDYLDKLDTLAADNRRCGELIEVVVRGLPKYPPQLPEEETIFTFLHALYDFTFVFQDSMAATSKIVAGLGRRALGEEYSSLDYLRELNIMRQVAEDRRKNEQELTAARKPFLALPPEGAPPRSPDEIPPPRPEELEAEEEAANPEPDPVDPAAPPTAGAPVQPVSFAAPVPQQPSVQAQPSAQPQPPA